MVYKGKVIMITGQVPIIVVVIGMVMVAMVIMTGRAFLVFQYYFSPCDLLLFSCHQKSERQLCQESLLEGSPRLYR